MTIAQLDLIFPFFVLFCGAILTVVTHLPVLMKIAEQKFSSEIYEQLKMHRTLSLVFLVVGGLWSLQNIWYLN